MFEPTRLRPQPAPQPAAREDRDAASIVSTALTSRPVARRNLEDRRALVIGGSRGIGAAIARRLAREGAHVGVTWASRPELADATVMAVREHGTRAVSIHADSLKSETLATAVDESIAALGGLDIFIHCAGVAVFADAREITVEDLDKALAVNLRGAFLATQAAARRMSRGGRIIVIGSVNADRSALPLGSLYAMTKAGLQGMVRGMARDLGPAGITVNIVQPGPVDTDMNPAGSEFAKIVANNNIPVRRYGTPDEVAAMVAFVAGPEADYMTGTALTLDGGFAA